MSMDDDFFFPEEVLLESPNGDTKATLRAQIGKSNKLSHEEVELAFRGTHFGQIDMEEADRITVELLPSRLSALDFGQPADAMAFQTAM
jgi:hypothetical protein